MIGQGRHNRTFKVKVHEVLDALRKNKAEHIEIVEEAQAKFRELYTAEVERMLKDALEGRAVDMTVNLVMPTNHTDYYDNAILTLEMTQRAGEEIVELDSGEIERFVRNKWEWMHQFAVSNARYSDKARKFSQ